MPLALYWICAARSSSWFRAVVSLPESADAMCCGVQMAGITSQPTWVLALRLERLA